MDEIREQTLDEKAIDKFPQLKPLLAFDGSEVDFHHNGKTFTISTIGKDLTPNINFMMFGLWEKVDGKLIPVGYYDCFFKREERIVKGDIKTHHLQFKQMPNKFHILDSIEMTPLDIEKESPKYAAFAIDKKYRQTGIADIFNTQTQVIFEALDAKEVRYTGDMTTHSQKEPGFVPQFKTDSTGLTVPQSITSFYSKFATSHEIIPVDEDPEVEEGATFGGYTTIISPKISTFQEHLLNLAFH